MDEVLVGDERIFSRSDLKDGAGSGFGHELSINEFLKRVLSVLYALDKTENQGHGFGLFA